MITACLTRQITRIDESMIPLAGEDGIKAVLSAKG